MCTLKNVSPHNFQVEIPGDQDTTYWCVAVRIPEDVRSQQHYIYKVYYHVSTAFMLGCL